MKVQFVACEKDQEREDQRVLLLHHLEKRVSKGQSAALLCHWLKQVQKVLGVRLSGHEDQLEGLCQW
jgi:ABC-type transporter Mla MlaB component